MFWETFLEGIYNTSLSEWIAVLTGLCYVILAAYGVRLAWFFAFVSTLIYMLLTFNRHLYIESFLQLFYVIMAVYGWFSWRKKTQSNFKVEKWPYKFHLINVFASTALAIMIGYFFGNYTNQKVQYLDAFTTVFSLLATFMVAKKILENWLYWIVINIGLFFLYLSGEMYLTAFQYLVFSGLAVFGYLRWYKLYKSQIK